MKKIDVGQTVSILANFGVIAGIVFLAVELRQNNEFLAAEAGADRRDIRRQAAIIRELTCPELRHAIIKAENGPISSSTNGVFSIQVSKPLWLIGNTSTKSIGQVFVRRALFPCRPGRESVTMCLPVCRSIGRPERKSSILSSSNGRIQMFVGR